MGGRTALHTALLRPGHERNRIAVLDQILSHDISGSGALVNVQDDMERSPLWYAVKAGFVGCARHLIRAGALVSMGSMSCLHFGFQGNVSFFTFLQLDIIYII